MRRSLHVTPEIMERQQRERMLVAGVELDKDFANLFVPYPGEIKISAQVKQNRM